MNIHCGCYRIPLKLVTLASSSYDLKLLQLGVPSYFPHEFELYQISKKFHRVDLITVLNNFTAIARDPF